MGIDAPGAARSRNRCEQKIPKEDKPIHTPNRRSRGLATPTAILTVLLAVAVLAAAYYLLAKPALAGAAPTAPDATPSLPLTVEPARVEWGARVEIGNAAPTNVSPAPTATTEIDALKAELEVERTAREAAEACVEETAQRLANEQLLNRALAHLDAGEGDQMKATAHLWAGRQLPGFGDVVILDTPLPEEVVHVLRPTFVVSKHHDRDGSPFWVLKRARDDKALSRLR